MATHYKILLSLLLVCALTSGAFNISQQSISAVTTIRLGHSMDVEHVVHKSLVHFKHELERISDNTLQVEIYASGQLGSERDLIELLQIGSLAMTKVSIGALEAFVPEMQVFNLPYVFRDNEHYWRTLNSDLGKSLLEAPTKVDLRGLAYFDAGSRSFYTCTRGINTPDDLTGLKIRTMKSQSAVSLVTAMGASATPISFGELYTALQQGVVDGAENNPITFYKSRHYEICKNFTLDEHNSIPDIIMISEKVWQTLNQQKQTWITQAMASAVHHQRALWASDTQDALTALKKAGINIIYPDKSGFMHRVEEYKQSFDNTAVGELLKQIERK
jgi:tripartite ATP-independent transporter DctP family solute receptor